MIEPSYLRLYQSGELKRRVDRLEAMLESCDICPRDCHVNRLKDEVAICYSGYLPVVSSYTPHFGEEPALSGTHGAGNIFMGLCNLRCVYCQNFQISQNFKTERQNEVSFERLAEMMLELQAQGCHNINFVSPTHFASQIIKSVYLAVERGLRLPIVYNTNAYDSVEVLKLLDGIVDVYLPDLKYSEESAGKEYSKVPDYVERARAAIKEMYRQMAENLVFDENGLLKRGLVIRLLVLPNDIAGIEESLQFIHDELSPKVALSLMAQYYPTNKVTDERYVLISRRIRDREWIRAVEAAEALGMKEGWQQELETASEYYRPDFTHREQPFKDISDFKGKLPVIGKPLSV
ncbi:MAG TPA: radical SAM protein [Blastocatellia bacterium]|nr:radical SAM protein [Blastocatellia bacterium]